MKHIDKMTEDGLEGLNGAGFWALISRARGRPIFPHLQRVSSIQLRHMRTYEPIFLLSPALREAKVVIPVDNEHVYPCKDCQDLMVRKFDLTMGPLMWFLHLQSPHLTSLHIAFWNTAPDLDAEDVRSMSLFKSLRQLDIDLQATSLRALLSMCTELDQLVSLSLVIRDDFTTRKKKAKNERALCTLTDLKIRGPLGCAAEILAYAKASALQSVVLIGPLDQERWTVCLDALATHFSDSITTLGVTLEDRRASPLTFSNAGDKLYALHNMEQCFLEFVRDVSRLESKPDKIPMTVTDNDIVKAARAWPRLRKFILSCAQDDQTSVPSAESIEEFAMHCPDLETLVLPGLDASSLPSGVNAKVERCYLSGLETEDGDYGPCAVIGYVDQYPTGYVTHSHPKPRSSYPGSEKVILQITKKRAPSRQLSDSSLLSDQ